MFNAEKVTSDMIDWIRAYFDENASPETKAVIGVSGGKDSSVVLAACVKALGKERVLGVLMPQGVQSDIGVSYDICKELDISCVEVNIEETVNSLYDSLKNADVILNEVALFNTPARIRMATLYAVSASVGGRVANTCNLSEDWVGYATKFGDGAGDFSPLSHLTVSEVKAVGKCLGIPDRFVEKTPIDGLCGKTDEENLGFTYDVLDHYIRDGICDDEEVKAKIDLLHERNLHKVTMMPIFKPCN